MFFDSCGWHFFASLPDSGYWILIIGDFGHWSLDTCQVSYLVTNNLIETDLSLRSK